LHRVTPTGFPDLTSLASRMPYQRFLIMLFPLLFNIINQNWLHRILRIDQLSGKCTKYYH
jgi:hypothetical protein